MRIDFHYGPQPTSESDRSRTRNTASRGSSLSGEVQTGEDQAQLSGTHAQVQALLAQVSRLPESRQERIQSLRQAIQSGQYKPDPDHIAGGLFTHLVSGAAS